MNPNVRRLCVGLAVEVAGYTMVASFFFLYLRNVLGLGYAEIGLLVTAAQVVPLALLPFTGLLADRYGRRRLLLFSLVGEGLMLLLIAEALATHWLLGLILFVAGLAVATVIGGPALWAYVADFAGGSERTLAYTWLRVGANGGFAAGAVAGGVLIELIGFAPVAGLAGVINLAVALYLVLQITPSPYDVTRADRGGGSPTAAIRPEPRSIGNSFRVIAGDRTFLALCAGVGLFELTTSQWTVTVPLFANTVLGIPYALIGLGLSMNALVVVIGQAPMTQALLGQRHTTLLAAGGLLYVIGFLLLGVPSAGAEGVLLAFFVAVFVISLGENVQSIPLTTLPSNLAPPNELGSYIGTFSSLYGIGTLLAPALGGVVLAFASSGLVIWGLLALPCVPAFLIVRGYVAPRIREKADRA